MLLNLGGTLVSSHAAFYPLLPHGNLLLPRLAPFSGLNLTQHRGIMSSGISSRRRMRSNSASSGPRSLHPSGSGPEGVPSTLFKFQPRSTKQYRQKPSSGGGSGDGSAATTIESEGSLHAGLIDESDLPQVSALLVRVFEQGVVLADGEFNGLESVLLGAPLEMTNNYMDAIAYNEIFYALKSRCGKRLARGDFDRSSDALVLAVRDRSSNTSSSKLALTAQDGDVADRGGEIVAVVELTIRQPDGKLPFNWPFPVPWRQAQPPEQWQPYMCNLAVADEYRRNGYGKQLVRLCEHVAKNHWGYEGMYLHVDINDPASAGLYSSMGYQSLEKYDAPLWMRKLLGLPTIRYQVKHFKGRKGAAAKTAMPE
ncbi:unnamed protein product [Pylaiella littoralis]